MLLALVLLLVGLHSSVLTIGNCAKLNVPRVLLPYNHDIPSKFTLEVHEGGCYSWTSSRDEVLIEELTENGCSDKAIVSAVSRSKMKLTSIILAKDVVSGFSLRCDVIVDSIDRLEIVTTTRELYAEEAPEEFEVRAYDDQGNEFSTLEGQTFIWRIQTVTEKSHPREEVLRFISFEASPYETPPSIAPLEAQGKQGYMVLIEGSHTGVAKLSVGLVHAAYKDLPLAEVDLMVIANLFLDPPDIYILPHTTVKYAIFNLKQGIFHPFSIEGSQYFLHVMDNTVATLENDGISVTGFELGTTMITLQDGNVRSSGTQKYPVASLHVVEPSYLKITIFPHKYPSLIVGYSYTFHIEVFDKNNNVIFLSDNIVIETTIAEEYIETTFISRNGSYIDGIPLQTGTTEITAMLSTIGVKDQVLEISPPLRASLSLDIYEQLRVLPHLTLLPWDPVTRPRYQVNLTVEGVHGSVSWSSSASHIVEVNGIGQCQTKGEGSADITASLAVNPYNRDVAEIHIQEVSDLAFVEGVREVEKGHWLPLQLAMSTFGEDDDKFFMQCHKVPIKFETEGLSFSSSVFGASSASEEDSPACAEVRVLADDAGFSRVTAEYTTSRSELGDTTIVAAFRPLRPINPESGETVLALYTSKVVVFQGGPLPWESRRKGHYVSLEHEKSDIVSARVVKGGEGSRRWPADVHAVLVQCHELGEFTFSLRVGNEPSSSLPAPVEASSTVKVVCAVPDSIAIRATTSLQQGCPFTSNSQTVLAQCYKPLPLAASVMDSEGRKFDNISSLAIHWDISDSTLAAFREQETRLSFMQEHHEISSWLTTEWILEPVKIPGEVLIQATLKGYKDDSGDETSFASAHDSVKIVFVDDVQLRPTQLMLFNHRENQGEILISGGSGHFKLSVEQSDIATFKLDPKLNTIKVFPLSDGTVNLTLVDLCLQHISPSISVTVSSISTLDLVVRDRVEVGGSIEAEVIALDALERRIPVHALMKLTAHPRGAAKDANIIDASLERVNEEGNAVFLVRGKKIGETTLRVSCKKGTANLYSPSRPIQVFPSLTILPKNVTLLVGAVYQVQTSGGPFRDATIEFLMENDTVAEVSSAGVVLASSIGSSPLRARAVSHLSNGIPFVVDSKDWAIINVIALDAIRIQAPLRYIETGNTMPLYAMGMDNTQNPLSYATANPPLNFEWTLSNRQIASITTVYSENDISESNDNKGIVRLVARKPGRVTVHLEVTISQMHSEKTSEFVVLTDEMEIKVFETLKLREPMSDDAKILLSPNAETKIITNWEKEEKVAFKYAAESVGASNSFDTLVKVSPEGVVKAGNVVGETSVVATVEDASGISQSIAILVEVRPISYIEAVVSRFMKSATSEPFTAIPLGTSHHLQFDFHDSRGRVFTAVDAALEFRPSRYDLVDLQPRSNDSWGVNIRGVGQTVLHFWDSKNPNINDFVRLQSSTAVFPDKAEVPLGSFICLKSNLRSELGETGTWSSDNSALQMDPLTGTGLALAVRNVTAAYLVSPTVVTTAEVYISPIRKIWVRPPSHSISNIKRKGGFFVGVNLEGEKSDQSASSLCFPPSDMQPVILFTCLLSFNTVMPNIQVKDVVMATATYLPEVGFGCQIESLFDSDIAFATSGIELLLGVSVIKSGPQENVETPMTPVPFYPAAVLEKTQVVFRSNDAVAVVVIHGSPTLLSSFTLVSESGRFSAQIEDIEGSSGHLVITATDLAWSNAAPTDPIPVSLVSSLTWQKIQVNVSFAPGDSDECISPGRRSGVFGLIMSILSHHQNTLLSIICLGITFLCLVLGYRFLVGPGYKQSNNASVFASSPNIFADTSPVSKSPSAAGSLSSSSSSTPEDLGRRRFPQSPQRISLWSTDREPVYGSPSFRSSPRPAYEGSKTYSPYPST